jgi:trans-2-enoyl-CoA reductase
LESFLEKALLWFPCLHHILELEFEAATKDKLGPTSGPKEKYFSRFEEYFNKLSEAEKEDILKDAADKIRLLAPEDDLKREFQIRVKNFFTEFTASSSFQRGDYQEFCRIVMVRHLFSI